MDTLQHTLWFSGDTEAEINVCLYSRTCPLLGPSHPTHSSNHNSRNVPKPSRNPHTTPCKLPTFLCYHQRLARGPNLHNHCTILRSLQRTTPPTHQEESMTENIGQTPVAPTPPIHEPPMARASRNGDTKTSLKPILEPTSSQIGCSYSSGKVTFLKTIMEIFDDFECEAKNLGYLKISHFSCFLYFHVFMFHVFMSFFFFFWTLKQ